MNARHQAVIREAAQAIGGRHRKEIAATFEAPKADLLVYALARALVDFTETRGQVRGTLGDDAADLLKRLVIETLQAADEVVCDCGECRLGRPS